MKRSAIALFATAVLFFVGAANAEVVVTFDPPVVYPMGGGGGDVTTADVDADGDVDIISTTRIPDFIWVLINDGSGNFAPAIPYGAGELPRAVIAADLNNDGVIDIATANQGGGDVTVMIGDNSGAFAAPVHFATFANPMELAAGDYNGDGFLDLSVTHNSISTGPLMVLLNNGGIGAGWIGFQSPVTYSIGAGSRSVETVDIDSDGILDLITTNRGDGNVSVLLGNGDGTFDPGLTFSAGPFPRDSASGDFNGDGLVDIAVANFGSSAMRVLANNGSDINGWLGLFVLSASSTLGSGPHGIAAGDLDLDNDLDLLVVNVQSGELALSVMRNNGVGNFSDTTIESVNALSAASVTMADIDGDGDLDSVNSNAANAGSVTVLVNSSDTSNTCPADVNGDTVVDTADLGILLGVFGMTNPQADFNADGIVDTADLGILLGSFGPCQ